MSSIHSHNGELLKTFGERMKLARDLCNLTQDEAAVLLSFQTSSALSKIESGRYVKQIDINTVLKAARVYEVSCDFLLGFSDEWEHDPVIAGEKHIEGWLLRQWEKIRTRELDALRRIANKLTAIEFAVNLLIGEVKTLQKTFARFIELNREFQDMPCSATLVYHVNSLVEKTHKANNQLTKFKTLTTIKAKL